MDLGLTDKVIVITGGAGGIGAVAAECFLKEGARVVIGDCNREGSESVQYELAAKYGDNISFLFLDLREENLIREFVRTIVEQYGGIDCIVNNAAVFYFENLTEWDSLDPFDHHYQVALRGPLTLVQEAWRRSERSLSGSIINLSSVAGHVAEPKAFAYTTYKAALKGFTLSCCIEMAKHGGWSVSISPGHTWTPIHQKRADAQGLSRKEYEESQPNIQSTMFGRFLDTEEVGNWIVIAASPMGKAMTGQDLRVTFGIEPGGFNKAYETAA